MADSKACLLRPLQCNRWRSLAGIGVANSVQAMLIFSVGHPNAGRARGAFEAAQMQRTTRAFVCSAFEAHHVACKAGGLRQTERTAALTQQGL
jgi:hypothetical protein